MKLLNLLVAGSLTFGTLVAMTGTAGAAKGQDGDTKLIRMRDDCNPRSFNAVLGKGTCVGDGNTTLEELLSQLERDRDARAWRNSPDRLKVPRGTTLRVRNDGGEAHSFTKVRRFGPGCVPELNEAMGFPHGAMVRECRSPAWLRTIRGAGQAMRVHNLEPGRHRFQCLIHPWMRTRVHVEHAHD